MLTAARVPATCPMAPPCPLWTALIPNPQLALYEPVQAIGNRLLASIAADRDLSGWRVMMCCPGAWVHFQRREVTYRVAAVLALLLHDHAQATALGGRLEIIADFGDQRLAFTEPGTEAA
jgi:hypothetical protein